MKKEIGISETEWSVMEVLWESAPKTIGEIREALKESGWSDSTIKTLVRRLVGKGAVRIDDSGEQFKYFPAIDEKKCKMKETKSMIERLYHGSVKMMMASLASESSLSDDDVSKLMELIEKMDDKEEA